MKRLSIFLACLILAACGGGGGGSSSTAAGTITGVAATGSAISGRIYLKDAAAHERYLDTADGTYTFPIAGLTPPFMLKAEWLANGTTQRLYSFASAAGIANITPLAQMAVVAAAATNTLDPIYAASDATRFAAIASALPGAVTDLKKSLAPLLAKYSATGIDPISGKFAADHTGMDAVLDNISVSYSSGNVTVTSKTSGALILEAPADSLSHSLSAADWSAQEAAIANDPDIAVDGNGKSLVAWSELAGSRYVIRVRFLTGTNVAATTLSNSGDASLPRVAFDAAGNAIVVWAQFENNRNDIWTRRYLAASGTWSAPLRLSAANAVASSYVPDIGVDGSGNAVVTWHQGDGRTNHFDAWASRYSAANDTWSAPSLVSDGVNSAYGSRVAINTAGQGIIAWQQEQGDGTTVSNGPKDIRGRTVTTAGAWGASTQLNAVGGNVDAVYGQVAVAVDKQGNGLVLWVQSSGSLPFVIQAARYAAGSGWQASAVITNNVVNESYAPQVAFDGAGNALAVWSQQAGGNQYGGSNRYVAGTGWGTSGSFTGNLAGDSFDPHLALDADGNATVVWYQQEASAVNIRTNRYASGSGWGTPLILSTTSTDGIFTYPVPRIASNAAGMTVAVWGVDSN